MSSNKLETAKQAGDMIPLSPAIFHILLSLSKGDRHGYGMMQDIEQMTFGKQKLGAGTLYRSLQKMLGDDLIGERGAADEAADSERRKTYLMTPFGEAVFKEEASRLENLVALAAGKGAQSPTEGSAVVIPTQDLSETQTLVSRLSMSDAGAAIEFYRELFAADEVYRSTPDGSDKIFHAELLIGNSQIQISQEGIHGNDNASPSTLGGTPVVMVIFVKDADATFEKAVEMGAKSIAPMADRLWGDRYGIIEDPFGYQWGLSTKLKDLAPSEVIDRAQETFGDK